MMSYLTLHFSITAVAWWLLLPLYPCCRELGGGHSTAQIQGASLEGSLRGAGSLQKGNGKLGYCSISTQT